MARGGARPGAGAPRGDANGQRKKKLLAPKIDKPGVHGSPIGQALSALKANTPPPPPAPPVAGIDDAIDPDLQPLAYFQAIMRDPNQPADRRDRAAAVILSFCHVKPSEKGKKGEKEDAAQKAAKGRFGAPSAPRLVTSGGK